MSMPSAVSAPTVTETCQGCGNAQSVPEGQIMPPCPCGHKPILIDVYERKSSTPGYRFFVIATLVGRRSVEAFDDQEHLAIGKVKKLLGVGL